MTFWAYILRCADGKYYTGHTDNIDHRIAQHSAGAVPGWTQVRLPVELAWSQEFPTRGEALTAEMQIGNWLHSKKEALIRGDWDGVSRAARKRSLDTPSRQARRLPETNGQGERPHPDGEGETPPPVIVLVRPQLGENIGKAARAMLNFGLTEMRLVAPRDGWPNPQAGPAASGADVVLARATVFDSVADAVHDCAHVYATTVRKRGVTKPVVTPEAAAHAIHAGPGRSAILFGPERSGLETDDVALARSILTVPINPEFGSLNLAQAVILVAYEWSKHVGLASPPAVDLDPPAPQEEWEGMFGQLDAMLETSGFYFPPARVPATKRTLRTMLAKPGWTSMELRTLRGVLSALEGKKSKRS